MRALIVEQGWSRGALAATRALAQAGWTVGVATPGGEGLASSSRACSRRHRIAGLQPSPGEFVPSVAAAVREGGYDVVFGAGEAEVLALSAARDALGAVVPHGPHEDVVRALDKNELAAAAQAVGIAVPDVVPLEAVTDETTAYVVKARRHARPEVEGAPPRIDTLVVTGRSAISRRLAQIRALGGEPEIQVMHRGTLLAYSAVCAGDGRGVVAESMQQAARIWPPGAGASSRAETIPVDEGLAARAAALLGSLRWFGLAELQYIAAEDGTARLIDLNGRFYGSLSLAVAAGANLPAVWADLAVGRAVPAHVRARPGVRYQWGSADVRRALTERRGGLLRDLGGTLAHAVGAGHSVAAVRDPGPALSRLRAGLAQRSHRAAADLPAAAVADAG